MDKSFVERPVSMTKSTTTTRTTTTTSTSRTSTTTYGDDGTFAGIPGTYTTTATATDGVGATDGYLTKEALEEMASRIVSDTSSACSSPLLSPSPGVSGAGTRTLLSPTQHHLHHSRRRPFSPSRALVSEGEDDDTYIGGGDDLLNDSSDHTTPYYQQQQHFQQKQQQQQQQEYQHQQMLLQRQQEEFQQQQRWQKRRVPPSHGYGNNEQTTDLVNRDNLAFLQSHNQEEQQLQLQQQQQEQPQPKQQPQQWFSKIFSQPHKQPETTVFNADEKKKNRFIRIQLNKMSNEERSQGLHDLHGVSELPEETPQRLNELLLELDDALEQALNDSVSAAKSSAHNTSAYQQLLQQFQEQLQEQEQQEWQLLSEAASSPTADNGTCNTLASMQHRTKETQDYVNTVKLQCLRADRYQVKEATSRFFRYFEQKLNFFGPKALAHPIQLNDLSASDREALQTGYVQPLPVRDRAGRAILVLFGKLQTLHPVDVTTRLIAFVAMTTLRDVNVQKKGVVMVYYGVGQDTFYRDRPMQIVGCWKNLPMRIVGCHACYDHPVLHALFSLAAFGMESQTLCRLRCHYGTSLECLYNLMTFGISKDAFPLTSDGAEVDPTVFQRYLLSLSLPQEQQQQQQQKSDTQLQFDSNSDHGYTAATPTASVVVSDGNASGRNYVPNTSKSASSTATTIPPRPPPPPSSTKGGKDATNTKKRTKRTTNDISSSSATEDQQPSKSSSSSSNNNTNNDTNGTIKYVERREMDVIMGRGRHSQNAPGNIKLKQLLNENFSKYEQASKFEKTVVAELILKKIQDGGGRFLKPAPAAAAGTKTTTTTKSSNNKTKKREQKWVLCEDHVARDKIAHAFRNLRGTTNK